MSDHDCKGCKEYEGLTRRNFVGLTAGLAAAVVAPGWLPRVVYAASESSSRDVIVSIFLRGGADALTLCVPHGENAYYELRPELAIARPDAAVEEAARAIDLDGFFGLPHAMRALKEVFDDGSLAISHATGVVDSSRSHFDAMRFLEVGQGGAPANLQTGWLGRHLAATAPGDKDGVLRAVGIGFGLQRTLVGAPQALPIADLAAFGLAGPGGSRAARQAALAEMYDAFDDPLEGSAATTFRTIDVLEKIGFAGYRPTGGAVYPDDEFGYALKSAAALIKAEVGVEAVAIDLGGWDTHDFQGPVDGHMHYLMESLAGGLAALYRDLFSAGCKRFVAVTMSEFGRVAFENGSAGTDHGTGGLMMALGGAVRGGRVLGRWPGLEREQLVDRQDLEVTTDYRDVLWEILDRRAQSPGVRQVFTDGKYTPRPVGIV
jgi:uncharacterized protein (DUF1501 family)